MNQGDPADNCNQELYDKKAEHLRRTSVRGGRLNWVILSFVCCIWLSSCPLIQWSGPSVSFLSPNDSSPFRVWMKIAVPGWYWDCDLRTPLPSTKCTHYAVLQVIFFFLMSRICSRAALVWEKTMRIQEAHEIYLWYVCIC